MELIFYYIPFRTYPLGAIDEKDIEHERYKLTLTLELSHQSEKLAYDRILEMCWKGVGPGKLDSQVVTLLMLVQGKKVYLDKHGVLKNGKKQHYVRPGDFLWLYEFIERRIGR